MVQHLPKNTPCIQSLRSSILYLYIESKRINAPTVSAFLLQALKETDNILNERKN